MPMQFISPQETTKIPSKDAEVGTKLTSTVVGDVAVSSLLGCAGRSTCRLQL